MKKETSIQKKLLIQKYGSKLVEFAVLRTDTCRCLVIYVAVWDNVNISMIGSQIHRKESCLKSLFRMSGLLSNISVVGVIEDFWAESKKKKHGENMKWSCVSRTISAKDGYSVEDENDGIDSVGKELFQEVIEVIQKQDQNWGS